MALVMDKCELHGKLREWAFHQFYPCNIRIEAQYVLVKATVASILIERGCGLEANKARGRSQVPY